MPTWIGRDDLGRLVDITSDAADEGVERVSPLEIESGAGAEQTIRLLGPFPVAFDTPNITTTGIELATLEPGQIVVAAWWVNTGSVWAGTTTAQAVIFVGGTVAGQEDGEAWSDGYYLEISRSNAAFAPGLGIDPEPAYQASPLFVNAATDPDTLRGGAAIITSASVLGVIVEVTGNPLSAGQSDVYALIAEAAA